MSAVEYRSASIRAQQNLERKRCGAKTYHFPKPLCIDQHPLYLKVLASAQKLRCTAGLKL